MSDEKKNITEMIVTAMGTGDANKFQEILDGLADAATVDIFDNHRACGFDISWSMAGYGFGHLTLAYRKEENRWVADTEYMSAETITKILCAAAPAMAQKLLELDHSGKT